MERCGFVICKYCDVLYNRFGLPQVLVFRGILVPISHDVTKIYKQSLVRNIKHANVSTGECKMVGRGCLLLAVKIKTLLEG